MLARLYYPSGLSAYGSTTTEVKVKIEDDVVSVLNNNNLLGVGAAVDKNVSYCDTSVTASGYNVVRGISASPWICRSATSLQFGNNSITMPYSALFQIAQNGWSLNIYNHMLKGIAQLNPSTSMNFGSTLVDTISCKLNDCRLPFYIQIAAGPHYLLISMYPANLGKPDESNTFLHVYPTGIYSKLYGPSTIMRAVSPRCNANTGISLDTIYAVNTNVHSGVGYNDSNLFLKTPYGYGTNVATSLLKNIPYDGQVRLIPFGFIGKYSTSSMDGPDVFDHGWVTPTTGIYLIHKDAFADGTFFQHSGKSYLKIGPYAIPAG